MVHMAVMLVVGRDGGADGDCRLLGASWNCVLPYVRYKTLLGFVRKCEIVFYGWIVARIWGWSDPDQLAVKAW